MNYLNEEKKLLQSYKNGNIKDESFKAFINTLIHKNGDFRVSKHLLSDHLIELQFKNAICYEISLVEFNSDEVQIWMNFINGFLFSKDTVKSFDFCSNEQKIIEVIRKYDRNCVEEQYHNGLNHVVNMILITNNGESKMNLIKVYDTLVKVKENDIVFCFSNASASLYMITFDVAYKDLNYFTSKLPGKIISYQLYIQNDDWIYVTAETM